MKNLTKAKYLKVETPEDVILSHVRRFIDAKEEDLPKLQLTLTMGAHVFTGIPVKVENLKGNDWLLLLLLSGGLSYLPLKDIHSVTVLHFSNEDISADQKSSPIVSGAAPTRLATERFTQELTTGFQSAGWPKAKIRIDWANMGDNSDIRRSVMEVILSLEQILKKILVDQVGKQALSGVDEILIQVNESSNLTVLRENSLLTVGLGATTDLMGKRQLLEELIQKNL